jgi:hypothetical protein
MAEIQWAQSRRGIWYTTVFAEASDRSYEIVPKKNGKFFVSARKPGGAEVRLPYREFDTADAAKAWIEAEEEREAGIKARNISQAIQL